MNQNFLVGNFTKKLFYCKLLAGCTVLELNIKEQTFGGATLLTTKLYEQNLKITLLWKIKKTFSTCTFHLISSPNPLTEKITQQKKNLLHSSPLFLSLLLLPHHQLCRHVAYTYCLILYNTTTGKSFVLLHFYVCVHFFRSTRARPEHKERRDEGMM